MFPTQSTTSMLTRYWKSTLPSSKGLGLLTPTSHCRSTKSISTILTASISNCKKHYVDFEKLSGDIAARFQHGMEEINHYAIDNRYGAPLSKIEEELRELIERPVAIPHEDDLVARLINDPISSRAWRSLITNKFCDRMNTAPASDPQMKAGFRRYMIQDFFYLRRLSTFNAERAVTAQDIKTYTDLADRIRRGVGYALDQLSVLTSQLGVPASVVFQTPLAAVTARYLEFLIEEVKKRNWVLSLVALAPCIQSYFTIADNVAKAGTVDKNSDWYKLFVSQHKAFEQSALKQRALLKANAKLWAPYYPVARIMFITACGFEQLFWNLGLIGLSVNLAADTIPQLDNT
ncbi:Heme oxygenase-like protein [Mycena sanguinolenta]|uniref:Heme oxygenase-like protein n=1 Tax=Mycena sanguinolenta TaxID=230812 RepID=A0A8H6YLS9_9AGAR|nr:Heme oxygenase-like protein [Mycena sanguinolenta]